MEICLWPVMSVVFLFADLAMSMRGEKEANFALSAKPDTSVSKVINKTQKNMRVFDGIDQVTPNLV